MKRILWVVYFICLVGFVGCSNPFPEDVGLYTVSRGTTAGTAVEVAAPFEADEEARLDVLLESAVFSISMKDSTTSIEYPATCSAAADGAGGGMMKCTVSDEGQALPKEAMKIQMMVKKVIADEDVEWFAQDLAWWDMGTGKDPECLAEFGESHECSIAAKEMPSMNCMAKMKGSDGDAKDDCENIREKCFEQKCLGVKLLGYILLVGAAEDAYVSPELDLAAAAIDPPSAEDGDAADDGETSDGEKEGTDAGDNPSDPASMNSGDGCALVPGAGASAASALALLLWLAPIALVGWRRQGG